MNPLFRNFIYNLKGQVEDNFRNYNYTGKNSCNSIGDSVRELSRSTRVVFSLYRPIDRDQHWRKAQQK